MEYPEVFQDISSYQFIIELDDKEKIDLVQVYLGADKSTVKYTKIKKLLKEYINTLKN